MAPGQTPVRRDRERLAMALLTSLVFVGACLLFGMEPLVGRLLVPYFGGAINVWLTCLMFFQAVLLVGYLYSHFVARKAGPWHLLLLFLPLIVLPLNVATEISVETPIRSLLTVLLVRVALPFAVLSTTAVLAQTWLVQSAVTGSREPYPLYAASNAGSLVALLGYPLVIEPFLGLSAQTAAWTFGYVLYMVLVAAVWLVVRPAREARPVVSQASVPAVPAATPTVRNYALWLLLSGLPSALLLSVTNFIASEIGSFPMVWVLPLAIYLATFIVTFRERGGVPGVLRVLWLEVLLIGFLLYLLPTISWLAFAGHLAVLLLACVVAHGGLYEQRPGVRHLTHFYLTMAVGGWLGGVLISLVAPLVFTGYYEYPLILLGLAVTFLWRRDAAFHAFWRQSRMLVVGGRLALIAAILVPTVLGLRISLELGDKFRHRNFYGTYRIIDEPPDDEAPQGFRKLVHGQTLHGSQYLAPSQQQVPPSYFYRGGGIADCYDCVPSPRRIAVLGLGAGVVAAYARAQDQVTFYEIDPDNEQIARDWFTYLKDSPASCHVMVGDGRLALQEVPQQETKYDLLHMDAFSGDAIPTHLLTREALQLYVHRLQDDGLLLFHISNRYYDLRPILKATSAQLGLCGAMNVPPPKTTLRRHQNPNQCYVLARRAERLQPLLDRGWIAVGAGDGLEEVTPWTDDFVNILVPLVLKLRPSVLRADRASLATGPGP